MVLIVIFLRNIALVEETQFIKDSEYYRELIINETFQEYKNYSFPIDQMEENSGFISSNPKTNIKNSKDNYGGLESTQFIVKNINGKLFLSKELSEPLDLSRWQKRGIISLWMKLDKPQCVKNISVIFIDNRNISFQTYNLENKVLDQPNKIKQDDPYPDYYLFKDNSSLNKWEDFMLIEDWNYLFWKIDGNFSEKEDINFSKITAYKISLKLDTNCNNVKINLDNLRIQDGLQRYSNPLNGAWYAPNGAPMYGIFDVDQVEGKNGSYKVRLLNVKQKQYPSNGDHARILSNFSTPVNFTMKIKFRFLNVGLEEDSILKKISNLIVEKKNLKNTWFRLQYDFDNAYDPGHDWFGVFISLEYNKLGLISVSPIVRYFEQEQEPRAFNKTSRISMSIKAGKTYELDLTAIEQYAKATIYGAEGSKLRKIGTVEYSFNRKRYGDERRYPLSIEATGNTHLEIDSIELVRI